MNLIYRFAWEIAITVGIMIGGEGILIPAVYFSFLGYISFSKLIILAIIANLIADTAWYAAGRFIPFEKLKYTKIAKKYTKEIENAGDTIKSHGLYFLFISKFVVGTRTVMQLLCGINKIPVIRYAIVNSLGIIAYVGLLYGVSLLFRKGLAQFKLSISIFESLFAFIFIILIIISIWLGKKAKERWFPS